MSTSSCCGVGAGCAGGATRAGAPKDGDAGAAGGCGCGERVVGALAGERLRVGTSSVDEGGPASDRESPSARESGCDRGRCEDVACDASTTAVSSDDEEENTPGICIDTNAGPAAARTSVASAEDSSRAGAAGAAAARMCVVSTVSSFGMTTGARSTVAGRSAFNAPSVTGGIDDASKIGDGVRTRVASSGDGSGGGAGTTPASCGGARNGGISSESVTSFARVRIVTPGCGSGRGSYNVRSTRYESAFISSVAGASSSPRSDGSRGVARIVCTGAVRSSRSFGCTPATRRFSSPLSSCPGIAASLAHHVGAAPPASSKRVAASMPHAAWRSCPPE